MLKQVRRRTFSNWPHRDSPSRAQMIDAGFFNCNVGDRVICVYCNIICQQWTPHADDPCEIHKTLSPKCPYVMGKLTQRETTSISILNENFSSNCSSANAAADTIRSNEIVVTVACHSGFIEIPKRHTTFANWPKETLPAVDDLVRAGFFYTGNKTIVTCFYCNGSLQNWGANDNPTIEHARWFPHCAYAKQLCGDDLYRKIQESKRAARERAQASDPTNNTNPSTQKLQITNESALSRFVAARLDLPISQRLLDQNFKLSIIKRCWEDQLRLKQDDFETDSDLLMACIILQKQIDHINGKKENIIVPSIRMRQICEREQAEARAAASASIPSPVQSLVTAPSDSSNVKMSVASQSSNIESNSKDCTTTARSNPTITSAEPMQTNTTTLTNPCAICMSEEKRLACIPCGHLATCVPCGHSLRSCPICRREIEAFVRVYI
ncbi:unnamed protein product [Rotaria sordida]|uniref:RING-type domain-containing protein n=1 Tax=Rotaria sordida TaxID=392033 RepID=A0A819LYE4_9BILA|nr:unnamed protein product [Rotaria sordida]CAF3969731.1 unnamed protein product [Rotaria sordida]